MTWKGSTVLASNLHTIWLYLDNKVLSALKDNGSPEPHSSRVGGQIFFLP